MSSPTLSNNSTGVTNSTANDTTGVVGGYSSIPVTNETTAVLAKALRDDKLYAEDVASRLCFTAIDSIQSQVVAGTNYKYTVDACSVKAAADGEGKCGSAVASCVPKKITITVFVQSWTDTIRVSEIQLVGSQETGDGSKANDTSTVPAPTATTPTPTKSAAQQKSMGVAAVCMALLAVTSMAV